MESIPKSISPVCPRKDFCRLTGTVTERWDYRSIDKCNGVEKEIDVFEDDGPFFKDYKAVFNVTLELDQNEGDGSSSMNIFFYDRWAADASQKLLKGDTLTISGSHALLVNNHLPINSSGEHQCCIAIRESEQPCDLSSIIHFEVSEISLAKAIFTKIYIILYFYMPLEFQPALNLSSVLVDN